MEEITKNLTAAHFKWYLIATTLMQYVWEIFLYAREMIEINRCHEVPQEIGYYMTDEIFENAKSYTMKMFSASLINTFLNGLILCLLLGFELFAVLWKTFISLSFCEGEVFKVVIAMCVLTAIVCAINIPIAFIYIFCVEKKYGFNTQKISGFLIDALNVFCLLEICVFVSISIVMCIITYGGYYFVIWLILWFFFIMFVVSYVYLSVIMPVFYKFTLLEEGSLKTKIEECAKDCRFSVKKIFIMNASKRSTHSNAFVIDTFGYKRIVIFDTLLLTDKIFFTEDEVVAIVCHELGHAKHKHAYKSLVLNLIQILYKMCFFWLFSETKQVYGAFGFKNGETPKFFGLLAIPALLTRPIDWLVRIIILWIIRYFEKQADIYAIKKLMGRHLKVALTKMYVQNLIFPITTTLFYVYFYDHPPLMVRLSSIEHNINKLLSVRPVI